MSTSQRCRWASTGVDHHDYHDNEWGRPTNAADLLFEKLCLEGFQSGLSWLTILKKRENFRAAFDNFDFKVVAAYGPDDVDRLLGDAGIVRHRGKIEATINNAKRACELEAEQGSIVDWIWHWAVKEPLGEKLSVPAFTVRSKAFSADLKKRGWKFVGPTTAYAFMQSEGLVNDHERTCLAFERCEQERQSHLQGRKLRADI